MTRISFTLALATLTLSLAPAVHATALSPESSVQNVSVTDVLSTLTPQTPGVCTVSLTPVLAEALGLSAPAEGPKLPQIALACNNG